MRQVLKRKGTGVAFASAVLVLLVTGCGVNPDEAPQSAGHTGADAQYVPPQTGQKQVKERRATTRETGTIRVAGKAQGSLTPDLVKAYRAAGGTTAVTIQDETENRAFRQFCAGRADVVDSARPISASEYRQCIANGIQPVQFQVASDAAVLAIKNETDVGTDCLSFDEVRNIFRAGSTINSWSQVGYGHDLGGDSNEPRMKVAGPDENSNVFGFFGQYVLGDPEPTMLSVRSDYESFPTDAGVRRAVVGSNKDFKAAAQYVRSRQTYQSILDSLSENRRAVRDARAEVAKGIADGRTAAAKARDRRKLAEAKKNLENLINSIPEAKRYLAQNRAALRRLAEVRGTLGLFRFSYYEAFEEQLRPMEISASNDFANPECIFPSQATVTNATYPLARQLLLTINYKNMTDTDLNDFLVQSLSRSQQLAENAALVPLPDDTQATELAWLNGSTEPDIIFYESGSGTTVGTKQQADSASGQ
ncbi:MAG: substrate-binding domain-containing protein [Solirubrobacterales bacterium]|nr:substrate-binding domain-containing protein [Solirubrobacterales bacterium]HRV59200.1 substrate-binding domain-containing protein [Solirubrobacterales bacterium]